MSKVIEYHCDRCGKLIDEIEDVTSVDFLQEYDDFKSKISYDLCPVCCRDLDEFITKYKPSGDEDSTIPKSLELFNEFDIDKDCKIFNEFIEKNQINPSLDRHDGVKHMSYVVNELLKRELAILRNPYSIESKTIRALERYRKDKKHYELSDDMIEICIDSVKKDCPNCKRRRDSYNRGFSDGYEE